MSDNIVVDGISTGDIEIIENKDNELDNLLNDALRDFENSMQFPQNPVSRLDVLNPPQNQTSEALSIEPLLLENLWNEPSMKEAMSHFESSIRSVFNSSNIKNAITKNESTVEKDANINNDSSLDNIDIDSLINDFRKMAKMTAETFSKDSKVDSNIRQEENVFFTEEFSKGFMEVAQRLPSAMLKNEILNNEDEDDHGFHSMVSQTIKSLSDNNKDLEQGGFNFNDCSEHLGRLLKGVENNESINKNFYKFMKICLKTIKLVVYPSLKDLCEKYPSYIERNKLKLLDSEISNYKNQYKKLEKICKVFEMEGMNDTEKLNPDYENDNCDDIDNEKTDKLYKKFINILNIMKEIQDCGHIPEELVDKQTNFFEDVKCSLSKNENSISQNCSIS